MADWALGFLFPRDTTVVGGVQSRRAVRAARRGGGRKRVA
jgi:hypothetical protein